MNPFASLRLAWVVFWKEVQDNLRDRRSLVSSTMSALVGPMVVLLLIVVVGKTVLQKNEVAAMPLAVQGMDNSPTLIEFLRTNGISPYQAPENIDEAVRSGRLPAVLIIPDGYQQEFRSGNPAIIRLVYDSSRQSNVSSVERVRLLLDAYNGQIASLRLLARGISPVVVQPLSIERVDVATPESQAVIFLNMMPYFVVLVVFLGGMYVILDTTAGERERGSLEPLLINPVPRWALVVGKLAAAIPFAVTTLLLTLLAFLAAFNLFPIEDYVGIPIELDVRAMAGIFLIALPMILLASALQMIIATFTRSFKEAQTYVAFLPLLPALPGILLAFLPIRSSVWTMLIPTFGQQLLINQLMRGETISALYVLISTAATLLVSALLILGSIRLYEGERAVLGPR